MRQQHLGIVLAVLGAACYGAHTSAARAIYADGGNAALVLLVTTWVRAIVLTTYCILVKKKLFQSRQDVKQAFRGGLFHVIVVTCVFVSLTYLPAPIVVMIAFSHSLMLLAFLIYRGEIKLDVLTFITTISALLGLSLAIDAWDQQTAVNWFAVALAFVAAMATVSRVYVYGQQTKERNPAVVAAENFLFAAPLATTIVFFLPTLHLPASLAGYSWLALASAALAGGTFCMFYGISLLGAFRYSLFAKMEPLFTSLYSVCFLDEVLKLQQYVGIGLVVGSLALYQILEHRKTKSV